MFEQPEDAQKEASGVQGLTESLENTSFSSSTPEQTQSEVTPEHVFQEISKIIKNCESDKNGTMKFPENMNPVLKAAVIAELRRRDTQAHITNCNTTTPTKTH